MQRRLRLLALFLLALPGLATADYLETRRATGLRTEPQKEAALTRELVPGDTLRLLEPTQTNGYYHAQVLRGSEQGWVYRTSIRRYRGSPALLSARNSGFRTEGGFREAVAFPAGESGFAARHLALGKPEAVYERVREGYVLAQDARLKIPLWVQYELARDELRGPAEREGDFRPDTSIPALARAELADYRGSGFDRGHMAPAGDMKRSEQVMSESFLLSNMCPQVGIGFNRQIWKDLEEAVRGWVEQRGRLTIITGPVFSVQGGEVRYQVIGKNHVAVPTAFFKIVVDHKAPGSTEALAFLLPNETLAGHDLEEFLTSIDAIEAATGLDFLSALPDSEEQTVEAQRAERLW